MLSDSFLTLSRHGSREEQCLPFGWYFGDDLFDIIDKSHIEHTIGLIEYKYFEILQVYKTLIDQNRAACPV
jgi:hypothetical protein